MSRLLRSLATASRARVLLARATRGARSEKTQRSGFYRDLWRTAAGEIGATLLKSDGDLLVFVRGHEQAKVDRNYTDLDGPVTLRAAGNKPFVHDALRESGIPTPDSLAFSLKDLTGAFSFLARHGESVVKPAAGTGAGAGVTTGVRTHRQLVKAAVAAAGHGPSLLIEKQIAGRNLRLLYLDGRLLDAVERCPPSLVGDGKLSVAQLVHRANQHRREQGALAAQVLLKHDLDMKHTLAGQGLSWRHVPAQGQSVCLKTVINDNAAAENISVTDRLCDAIVEIGARAAQALDVRVAGVDIVTPDLSVDLRTAGGVVLEINTTPGLYVHRGKQGISVAATILQACFEQSRQNRRAARIDIPAAVAVEEISRVSSR